MRVRGARTGAASRPTGQQPLRTSVVRKTAEFASLRGEWDGLYGSCPAATPFSSWEWLFSWWEHYGEGAYELRLLTLRDPGSGLLVGLLPLMVRRGPGFGRLLLVGGDKRSIYSDVMTPYKDVLVREGWEGPVARNAVRALKELDGWRVADLQELMPGSAAWGLFREWDGPKVSVPIVDYVLIRAVSWEGLLSSLSRRLRKTARRTLRQAERDGLRREAAGAADAGRAARTLVALHRELWRGRRVAPEHLTPRYEAFVEAAARRLTARGIGRVSEFRDAAGEVLVSQLLLFDGDFVGVQLMGASEEACRRYQFDTLSNWDAVNVACSKSSPFVSFMDGMSWHKQRWASEAANSHRAILGRSKAAWIPYAGYHVARDRFQAVRSEAHRYLHSESAPRWVKTATERYYALLRYVYSESAPRWVKMATERYWELRARYGYGWLRYRYELARAHRGCKLAGWQARTEQRDYR